MSRGGGAVNSGAFSKSSKMFRGGVVVVVVCRVCKSDGIVSQGYVLFLTG